MGGYIPMTESEQQEMLKELGLSCMDDLFSQVPKDLLAPPLNMPKGKSEYEVQRIIESFARDNKVYKSVFRGAGAYRHFVPSILRNITTKETFLTAYTPYQAEISQGNLQIIFEFQSDICALTGMDVSNASVYDGATAAAEAITMCLERKRSKALLPKNCQPDILEVCKTYTHSLGTPVEMIAEKDGLIDLEHLEELLDESVSSVLVQSPNYYGLYEDVDAIVDLCHAKGVKVIMHSNPMSLAISKTPGEYGVDIAVGEGQPMGISMSYGGPYCGFMACTTSLLRRMPGRIVGQTTDRNGKRCFVLTLQAREQHIRREKSSSSICSNQALCALAITVYLASLGPQGLCEVANQCYAKTHYLAEELEKIGYKRRHKGEFFHEFVTETPPGAEPLLQQLDSNGILGGLEVDGGILWCCTEVNTKNDIDHMVRICKEVAAI